MNLKDLSTLQIALGLSVIAHAGLLMVRFVDPAAFERTFKDTPLEVILVNARTNETPDKAQAIAQVSMAGGGTLDKGRATSPLPPSAFTAVGESAEESRRQQIESLQAQQMVLLTQIRNRLASLPQPDPREQGNPNDNAAQREERRQLLELLAQIERRVQEENARPKRRHASPATRAGVEAIYTDATFRKLEQRGTQHFPEAGGQKLYGELTMTATINHDGRLLDVRVDQGSGNTTLDRRALAIVRSVDGFGPFTPEMRRQFDQLVLVARFRFTRSQTLEAAALQANPAAGAN